MQSTSHGSEEQNLFYRDGDRSIAVSIIRPFVPDSNAVDAVQTVNCQTGSFQVNGCLLFLQKISKYDREGRRKGILGLTDDSVLIVQSKGSPVELVLCELQIAAWTLRARVLWLKEREMR